MRVTVYRAEWVLPVSSPPIRDGAVLVDGDGRIAAVAPAAALDMPDGADFEDLGAAAILPGLVNVHAHPELAMFRGALEDLSFPSWILRLLSAKRSVLQQEDYLHAARWTMVEAMRAGITTLAATEASGASFPALLEAGLRGVVYLEVFGPDPTQAPTSLRQLSYNVEQLRQLETDRVRVGISPHAPYTVSDRLFTETAEYARVEMLPLAIHAAESAAEQALVTRGEGDFAPGLRSRGIATPVRGRSTIELLDRLGVLDARPLLIHCLDVDAEDIRRIVDSGSAVAHCPIANAKLGHGAAPLLAMLEAGVRVGFGTDGVGSNNRIDLIEEARIASLLQRAVHQRGDVLGADELLRICTLDGARVLGLEDRIGSLEAGKEADLCAVGLDAPHVRPVHDPTAAVFHAARASDVRLTVVGGTVVYRDGQVLPIDVPLAMDGLEAAAERVRSSQASSGAG